MTYQEIQKNHAECYRLIAERRLSECFEILQKLLAETSEQYFQVEYEKLKEIYQNIMKYTVQGVNDPEREKIYTDTIRKIIILTDTLSEHVSAQKVNNSIYQRKAQLFDKNGQLSDDPEELLENLKQNSAAIQDKAENDEGYSERAFNIQENSRQLFYITWLITKYGDSEKNWLSKVKKTADIPWQYKSLIISGITMGLLQNFDVNKIHILLDFYEYGETQVWQRALVGILLGLYHYDEISQYYPELITRLEGYKNNPEIARNIEAIMIQMIKSKETEKITKKWEEEILPEMAKMKPKIEEKLSLDDMFSDDITEDKNPDWETFFEDSPDLLDKLQEFSQMQLEGSDVFMSAFSRLKNFDFFKDMSNWFMPFDKSHYSVIETIKNENADLRPFFESLEQSFHLCNSDKYSFCFNIKFIPEQQKQMMTQVFNQEVESMKELEESEEKVNEFAKSKSIYAQYFQDLYRFFKLYSEKELFTDIFTLDFDLYNKKFYRTLVEDQKIERNIAELYFEKNYFNQALDVYLNLSGEEYNKREVFEKIAYSYQRTGKFKKALDYYKKADLFDTNKPWIYRKIAFCYRKLNMYDRALDYYHEAEKLKPENLNILTYIGHTYLQKKEYNNALQYYFKVEYLSPDNKKIQRPIAWCSFALGKFDTAIKYNEKLLQQDSTNQFDLMNTGHVYLSRGEPQKAYEYYVQSLQQEEFSFKQFLEYFEQDRPYIIEHGVDPLDIDLLIDYLHTNKNTELSPTQ